MRKLMGTLLMSTILIMCFSGITPVLGQETLSIWSTPQEYEEATGKKIEKFDEAPMLRARVATGELEPLAQRLPEEPFVVVPLEIGQYGGTLNGIATAPMSWEDPMQMRRQFIYDVTPDYSGAISSVFKSCELSDDMKTLTIHFRKGMKWSDGAPFTADDCLFWFEDIQQNEEVWLWGWAAVWSPGGEPMDMEKVDDYTLRLHFAIPNPSIIKQFTLGWQLYYPKHYLKTWLSRYNPKAGELAAEEGYETVLNAFWFHADSGPTQQDAELPTLRPWMLKERTTTQEIFERNPYFWKVDNEGNQLPYADTVIANIVSDMETANLKIIAGEIDFAGMPLNLENYPLYRENEKQGNYRTLLWRGTNGSEGSFGFNITHKDPVLREIFQDIRFRRAMSLAINRDEINEVVFSDLATPRQVTVLPTCSFYKEEWAEANAQYDLKEANALLDEMDLKWDSNHQWRLRPDGETLAVTFEYWEIGSMTTICELVKEYWEATGVKVEIKSEELSLLTTRQNANDVDISVSYTDCSSEPFVQVNGNPFVSPGYFAMQLMFAIPWKTWYDTDGEAGEEPPQDVKELVDWVVAWPFAGTDEEYIEIGQNIYDYYAENAHVIGTVGMAKTPLVVKNDLGNIPEEGYFGSGASFWMPTQPSQWFKRQ